jgi:hypothetical protein
MCSAPSDREYDGIQRTSADSNDTLYRDIFAYISIDILLLKKPMEITVPRTSIRTGGDEQMPTLYLTEVQALVRRDGEDCLLVQIPERRAKDGATPSPARKERIPLIKIDEVVVLGEVTLTASAMHLLLERNIEITFLGHHGQFKGRLSPSFSKNAILRLAQYRAHQDKPKSPAM